MVSLFGFSYSLWLAIYLIDYILFDVTNLIFAAEYKLWTQLVAS
jgi:hypothetical protein